MKKILLIFITFSIIIAKAQKEKSNVYEIKLGIQNNTLNDNQTENNVQIEELNLDDDEIKNNETISSNQINKSEKQKQQFINPIASSLDLDIKNIIAEGEVSKQISIPTLENGILKSLLIAKTMQALDDQKLAFQSMFIRNFSAETQEESITIRMPRAIYYLNSKILASDKLTIIQKTGQFTIAGEKMAFDTKNNLGKMIGKTIAIMQTSQK